MQNMCECVIYAVVGVFDLKKVITTIKLARISTLRKYKKSKKNKKKNIKEHMRAFIVKLYSIFKFRTFLFSLRKKTLL